MPKCAICGKPIGDDYYHSNNLLDADPDEATLMDVGIDAPWDRRWPQDAIFHDACCPICKEERESRGLDENWNPLEGDS